MKNKFKRIKMLVTDCDGVLTNGVIYYSDDGNVSKGFNIRDGVAFNKLRVNNIYTAVISGDNSQSMINRTKKLNVDAAIINSDDKLKELENLCRHFNIKMSDVLYVGDDLNDLDIIENVYLSFCPKDAAKEVRKKVKYILKTRGGEGVIREIVDKFLKI